MKSGNTRFSSVRHKGVQTDVHIEFVTFYIFGVLAIGYRARWLPDVHLYACTSATAPEQATSLLDDLTTAVAGPLWASPNRVHPCARHQPASPAVGTATICSLEHRA